MAKKKGGAKKKGAAKKKGGMIRRVPRRLAESDLLRCGGLQACLVRTCN
jgi:hypothetical protein